MAVVLKPVASPRHLKPGKKDKTARSGDQKCGGVMAIASEERPDGWWVDWGRLFRQIQFDPVGATFLDRGFQSRSPRFAVFFGNQ